MRLYAPLYEGDSFLRPDAAIDAPLRTIFKAPDPAANFVRSNIQAEAANLTADDIRAIVRTAHMMRAAEVARLMNKAAVAVANWLKAADAAVADWFERVEYQERDNFFAASSNLADLEQRQRHYERTGLTRY